ncbi:hypothetical protein [Actinomadura sp. WMMA1423]|uniref:hypothetical protein n=1 Tax=Actinomadura sp. WMMA1423 TaxID=2591108 RepID=UPI0011463167|nr:hypothetical protein [Actinomadura sp. WMMA1423]
MEDEFAGKSREDFLTTVVVMWEMLRELCSRFPIPVGLPELLVDAPASVQEACAAVQRARDELLPAQSLPATTEALIAEGALEMLHALLMVQHTDVFGFTEWHAELWFRCLERVRFMCVRTTGSLKLMAREERDRFPGTGEPPEQE